MFDLNASEFKGVSIFNNGNGGLVKNVEITIEKKAGEGNTPDYKLIATDASGSVNTGFYYFTPNPQKSDEDNKKYEQLQVSRVVEIARAVMGKDYTFPAVDSSKQAFDVLFDLISKNCAGKLFNVYVTYGTPNRPSKYLGFRFLSFIEPAGGSTTTLRERNSDLLERVKEDNDSSAVQDELESLNQGIKSNFTI